MATLQPTVAPTLPQAQLYNRLRARFGRTPEWQVLTRGRNFERMTPHRAAHLLQLLVATFTNRTVRLTCNCPSAWHQHKHPLISGARDVQAV